MEWKKVSEVCFEVDKTFKKGMRVPGRVYATSNLLKGFDEKVIDQLTNVACLPGIQRYSFCMPDGHMGYGFPIGGVAAMDPKEGGVISPGGIGFDQNCGMRLMRTNLSRKDIEPKIKELVDTLFKMVPAGVGGSGLVKLSRSDMHDVMCDGAKWCVKHGYGWSKDLDHIEECGCIKGADPSKVSKKAIDRGIGQLGTLGSGNHYLEIQYASDIYDEKTAKKWGIEKDSAVVMVHCGSRGFGHQIGTDYLHSFEDAMRKYGIHVPDKELACAPFESEEGQDYYKAHACACNMAFANRQVILSQIRKAFEKVFSRSAESMEMELVYDVAHNIAKMERHKVDGSMKSLIVHRKGSTRSMGPSREEVGEKFKTTGQPVIVGGSMETGSYLCAGLDGSEETFCSTMHGSGRTMSRHQAKNEFRGETLQKEMASRGIYVKAVSMSGLAEEAGNAYKDISEVVQTMDTAKISKKVASLKPMGNVKG